MYVFQGATSQYYIIDIDFDPAVVNKLYRRPRVWGMCACACEIPQRICDERRVMCVRDVCMLSDRSFGVPVTPRWPSPTRAKKDETGTIAEKPYWSTSSSASIHPPFVPCGWGHGVDGMRDHIVPGFPHCRASNKVRRNRYPTWNKNGGPPALSNAGGTATHWWTQMHQKYLRRNLELSKPGFASAR